MEWNSEMENGMDRRRTQLLLTCVTGTVAEGCNGYNVSRTLAHQGRYVIKLCCQHSFLCRLVLYCHSYNLGPQRLYLLSSPA